MELRPIGFIRSPYVTHAPRQGRFSDEVCELVVFDEFAEGLDGIEKCEYIIVLYWMDKANREKLKVVPPGESEERGVFATRSPSRPNPIGFCVAKLLEVEGNVLRVKWVDALNNSPLIDIKVYSPEVDCVNRADG